MAASLSRTTITGGLDTTVRVWNVASDFRELAVQGHASEVMGVAVTPDPACSVCGVRTVGVWKVLAAAAPDNTLSGHSESIRGVALTQNGRLELTGSMDRTLRVWDLRTGKCSATVGPGRDWRRAVTASPDGRRAVGAESIDTRVRIWNPETGAGTSTGEVLFFDRRGF
ncbi:MAG: hypothetical protein ABL986_09305 [Vicinamibacterales bacterium]